MVSRIGKARINGSGARHCPSWIQSFVDHTSGLESAEIFRKWTAIGTIAATLEQKVWLETTSKLFPNLYTVLVGHPGVGKTRTIMTAREFLSEMVGLRIAPTSVTAASLIDFLAEAGKPLHYGDGGIYHSAILLPDDWSAFMSSFDKELVGALTVFYDANPYTHNRRGGAIRIAIDRPQLNLIAGTTPSDLIEFMPVTAWGQGFTSRLILVYSTEHIVGDDFAGRDTRLPPGMIEDLISIDALKGPFTPTPDFRRLVNAWRAKDEEPRPSHPKLVHYNTRRRAMLYKLSMVAAIDMGDVLELNERAYRTALGWLGEVEKAMGEIFENVAIPEAQSQDELVAWIAREGGVSEAQLMNKMARMFPQYAVGKTFGLLLAGERIVGRGGKFYTT